MKFIRALAPAALLAGLLGAMISTPMRLPAADPPPVPPPADAAREQRLAWFHEAKFGLFIHWGLYAIPAGEWKGRPVAGIGEWIMNRAQIPVREYELLATRFNPVKFDADTWVRLAQDAGMQYLVITSKHHDGFALFESKVSPYNVVAATPFHRDVLKELSRACERRNLRLGFYYSQAQDWHEPNGAGNTWDFGPDDKKNFDQYLRAKAEPQVRELLSNYGPVCLVWFDTPRMMDVGDRARRFADLVRTLQPDCLIDGRLGAEGDYKSTGDNAIPDQPMAGAWETPATINHTWGFKQDDDDWKSPGEIIFKLTDIVSKGGNYLLNVGPTAEGVIPERCVEILRAVGRWLKVNATATRSMAPAARPLARNSATTPPTCAMAQASPSSSPAPTGAARRNPGSSISSSSSGRAMASRCRTSRTRSSKPTCSRIRSASRSLSGLPKTAPSWWRCRAPRPIPCPTSSWWRLTATKSAAEPFVRASRPGSP
jgi:alpha-L-fucosidase